MKHIAWLLVIVMVFTLSACTLNSEIGSGNIVTEERDVSDFTRVSVSGGGDLKLIQGETFSLEVEADENLMQYIQTYVRGGELIIEIKPMLSIVPSRSIQYTVTMPEIKGLDLSGGVDFQADTLEVGDIDVNTSGGSDVEIGELTGDALSADTSGGGKIYISEMKVERTSIVMSGGGKFRVDALEGNLVRMDMSGGGEVSILGGTIESQVIEMSGGGKYDAPDLKSQRVEVDGSGGSRLMLWVEEDLKATLSGGGRLEYYGNPAITSNISGGAALESLGDH